MDFYIPRVEGTHCALYFLWFFFLTCPGYESIRPEIIDNSKIIIFLKLMFEHSQILSEHNTSFFGLHNFDVSSVNI